MRKTTILGKGLGLILALAILFSMAVPAFAAPTTHSMADFEIISCEPYAGLSSYLKVSYRIVTNCADFTCLKNATIKVDGQKIPYTSFKLNAEGKFVYEGYTYKIKSDSSTLKFEAVDMKVPTSTGRQVETVRINDIVTCYPRIYISLIGTGLGVFKSSVISLNATDDNGIKSIAVNGQVIASAAKTENQKKFSMVYDVFADGYYSVVVTDIDGNKTTAYFVIEEGEIVEQSSNTFPISGDFSTYIPFYYYFGYSSIAEMIEENPMLYYYYMYHNYDGDLSQLYPFYPSLPSLPTLPSYPSVNYPSINFPGLNFPTINFPNMGNFDKDTYLWYLYLNGMLGNGNLTENNDLSLYFLMMLLKGQEDGSNSELFTNILFYQYLYGNAISFTEGNKIIVSEENGTHKLTAPAIVNNTNAKYQWQKLVAGRWVNVVGGTKESYTLPAIVKGERYRVVISGNYFYSVLTSNVYIAGTTGVTPSVPSTPSTPSVPSVPSTPSDEFTADDITIRGLAYPMFSVKVGEDVTLIPNCIGYWSVDETLLGSASNFGAITLTGLKAGKTVISFTGFDGNGNMATKLIYVEIVG